MCLLCFVMKDNRVLPPLLRRFLKNDLSFFDYLSDSSTKGLHKASAVSYTHLDVYKRQVQFHPEACPGPQDSGYLFDRFIEMMGGTK